MSEEGVQHQDLTHREQYVSETSPGLATIALAAAFFAMPTAGGKAVNPIKDGVVSGKPTVATVTSKPSSSPNLKTLAPK